MEQNRENVISYVLVGVVLVSVTAVLLLMLLGQTVSILAPNQAGAATSSSVTVTATIASTISCATNVSATAFGTLDSANISTSTPDASTTISCANEAAGCTISLNDVGSSTPGLPGLWNATGTHLIYSPNSTLTASGTLTAGLEGYGVQATTTATGSGAALNVAKRYNALGAANTIGGLSTTTITLASSTSQTTNREIVIKHKAAIAATSTSGTYDDTITYGCTAN